MTITRHFHSVFYALSFNCSGRPKIESLHEKILIIFTYTMDPLESEAVYCYHKSIAREIVDNDSLDYLVVKITPS